MLPGGQVGEDNEVEKFVVTPKYKFYGITQWI